MKKPSKNKKMQDQFNLFLKDFKPDETYKPYWVDLSNGRTPVQEHKLKLSYEYYVKQPFIVFIIFVFLKQYKIWGKWEKIFWQIPVIYKEEKYVLIHDKWGFSIKSNEVTEEIIENAVELLNSISKATKYAEALIEDDIRLLVEKGKITLDNEYAKIRDRYMYFRNKSKENYEKSKNIEISIEYNILDKDQLSMINKNRRKKYTYNKNASYNVFAMLDSYFSMLEHTLVLLLPFIKEINIDSINIENFIGLTWKEKFKSIFDSNDKKNQQILNELNNIKEGFRNPLAHGHFLKGGHSFLVHVDYLGILPMTLTKKVNKLKYSFGDKGETTLKEIVEVFDRVDEYLDTCERTSSGMKFVKSKLPIVFDENSRRLYRSIPNEMIEEFIYERWSAIDDANNMDW